MNNLTFLRHNKWLLLGLTVLLLFLAACGSDASETEEPEAVATETEAVVETEEPTAIPVIEFDGVIADALPCEATIIPSDESRLNVRFREPTSDQSLMVGPLVPETPIRLVELADEDGTIWYRTVNPVSNITFNWIEARYIVLGDDCMAGDAAVDDTEATEEATEESD
ncbi:MAG: hypothetical protein Q9P01_20915 [Anaerolineae bacterium]|nr:hypothetical protein [Anaerolineae bacterium]MDQ7037209.1 hypothetical protein [Anaerolineae bacterium]